MCYNVASLTYTKLKYARRIGANIEDIERLEKEYDRLKISEEPYYFVNSFVFPRIPIHRNTDKLSPVLAELSLLPRFSKTKTQADKDRRRYRTANVKVETIREKRMYKEVLNEQWCLVVLDGFFEYYHHHQGKAYPFFIRPSNKEPFLMVGLWDEWLDPDTGELILSCNIMTQPARGFMKNLHNNPKRPDARMPLMVKPIIHHEIMNDISLALDFYEEISLPLVSVEFYPVGKLTGKDSIGNLPQAQEPYKYESLRESTITRQMG